MIILRTPFRWVSAGVSVGHRQDSELPYDSSHSGSSLGLVRLDLARPHSSRTAAGSPARLDSATVPGPVGSTVSFTPWAVERPTAPHPAHSSHVESRLCDVTLRPFPCMQPLDSGLASRLVLASKGEEATLN